MDPLGLLALFCKKPHQGLIHFTLHLMHTFFKLHVFLASLYHSVDTQRNLLYTKIMDRVFAVEIKDLSPTIGKFATYGDLVSVIVWNAFMLAGVISFLLLIFGGFGFIVGAGAGDTKRVESAQKTITGAIMGLLIVVTSYWIIQVLEKLTGVNLLAPVIP